ncbi:DoxX family protein [Portibacter lacus]|uniref:Membrane protein n=1 Tax=Portibacter lacus TaxID=1099794 RepID=A0AA37SN05_9BACT|nr:DoxX family protein [Portibacter lacus]GLR16056.1 membrane protein [Portibacter lacus]
MKDVADLIGRIFLSMIFFFEAYDSIAFFKQTKNTMTAYGLTWNQDMLLYAVIFVLVLGATLVLIGYYANLGAILILLYWIPITFIIFSFWNDPVEVRRIQSIMFMKNIAIVGGLLLLIVNGSGKYSVKRLIYRLKLPK